MVKKQQFELLKRYRRLSRPPRRSPLRNRAVPVALTALLCAGGWYLLREDNLKIKAGLDGIRTVLEAPENVAAYEKAAEKERRIDTLAAGIDEANLLTERLSSYPLVDSGLLGRIREAGGGAVSVEITGYDSATGRLIFQAESAEVIEAPRYVLKIRNTGLFETVSYSGYSFDGETYALHLECTLGAGRKETEK